MKFRFRNSGSKPAVKKVKLHVGKKPEKKSFSLILGTFRAIDRPKFIERLTFPADMTRQPPENISHLHSQYTQLFAFANQELAAAEVDIIRLTRKRAKREAAIFTERPGLNNQEKWKRESVIATHPAIGVIEDEITLARARVRFLVSLKENYDRLIATLSRELSRRQAFNRPGDGYNV